MSIFPFMDNWPIIGVGNLMTLFLFEASPLSKVKVCFNYGREQGAILSTVKYNSITIDENSSVILTLRK